MEKNEGWNEPNMEKKKREAYIKPQESKIMTTTLKKMKKGTESRNLWCDDVYEVDFIIKIEVESVFNVKPMIWA